MPAPDTTPASLPSPPRDPYAALRFANYRRYFIGNGCSLLGSQMTTYTVGYELYQRSHQPFVLGLVGLVQVIPIILLALPAGHLVDRYNRKSLVLIATFAQMCLWVAMGFSSHFAGRFFGGAGNGDVNFLADPHVVIMLSLLFFNGICRALSQPAKQTMLPALVPTEHFPNAITWNATLYETSNVVGPLVGGVFVAALLGDHPSRADITQGWAFSIIYWTNAALQLVQWLNIGRIHLEHKPRPAQKMTRETLLAGVRFVLANRVILAVMTLDMFAVLFGGATALLPVMADRVLNVGPIGLAWLRAAPSVGAVTMAVVLAHARPMRRAGRNMLWSVAGFGVATIVFGLSRNFWLSMVMLFFTGICDNISVVVRHSLVQLLTPDEMRGRVNAVNSVFISTSNELGDFESGTAADLATRIVSRFNAPLATIYGPMAAVATGGVGTLVVVAVVALVWPEVRAVKTLTHK